MQRHGTDFKLYAWVDLAIRKVASAMTEGDEQGVEEGKEELREGEASGEEEKLEQDRAGGGESIEWFGIEGIWSQ